MSSLTRGRRKAPLHAEVHNIRQYSRVVGESPYNRVIQKPPVCLAGNHPIAQAIGGFGRSSMRKYVDIT